MSWSRLRAAQAAGPVGVWFTVRVVEPALAALRTHPNPANPPHAGPVPEFS
jgi:hypothetical protein